MRVRDSHGGRAGCGHLEDHRRVSEHRLGCRQDRVNDRRRQIDFEGHINAGGQSSLVRRHGFEHVRALGHDRLTGLKWRAVQPDFGDELCGV